MKFKVGDTAYFTTRNLSGIPRYIRSIDDSLVGRKLVITSIDESSGLCTLVTGETTLLSFLRKTKPRGVKIKTLPSLFSTLKNKGGQF